MRNTGEREDGFLDYVDTLRTFDPSLSAVEAALLAAAHHGIANDSRTFSNRIGIAHALALRELNQLASREEYLRISNRDPRTLRTFFTLENRALDLLERVDSLATA